MDDATQPEPLIRAFDNAPQLKGLTSLGKIELPVNRERQRIASSSLTRPKRLSPEAAELVKAHQEAQDILEAHIISRNTGGYVATVLGYDAFMPGSHSTVKMGAVSTEQDPLLDKVVPVILLEIKPFSKQLVISHREAKQVMAQRAREAELAAKLARQKAHEELTKQKVFEITRVAAGDIISGVIYDNTNPKFIALRAGSLTVRIAWDELGWGRDSIPPSVNETVRVVIISRDEEKLILHGSIRLLTPDPWLSAPDKYTPGYATTAKVYNIVKFGLFVEVAPGIDGLLHLSCISLLDAEANLADHFNVGDEVPVVVDSLDEQNYRLSLTLPISIDNWPLFRDLLVEHRTVIEQRDTARELGEQLQAQAESQARQREEELQTHTSEREVWQQQDAARKEESESLQAELNRINDQLQSKHQQSIAQEKATQQQLDSLLGESRQLQSELESAKRLLGRTQISHQQSQEENRQLEQQLRTVTQQLVAAQQQVELAHNATPSEIEVPTWSDQELKAAASEPSSSEDTSPVYITFSNSKQIISGIDWSRENMAGEVYPVHFPHFNYFEKGQLLAYKRLCEYPNHFLASIADRVRSGSGGMLIANKAPAFHKTQQCKFAHSDYKNYTIPDEIKRRGPEAEGKFREWFARKLEQNPRYLENPILMQPLMVECMQHFKLETPPKPIKIANTGLVAMSGQDFIMLEKRIETLIANAAAYSKESHERSQIIDQFGTHAYRGLKDKDPLKHNTSLTDNAVRAILIKYDNDYKKTLIALLQTYYQNKFNTQLSFNGALLFGLGFRPCHACFNSADLAGLTPQSGNATPLPAKPRFTKPVSNAIQDDDNDLPF